MPTLRSAMRTFLEDWKSDVAGPWRQFLSDVEPAYHKIDESLDLDDDEVIFPGRKGAEPASNPCSPADVHATIFTALGINPRTELHDQLDRPFQICDGTPLPLV